MLLTPLKVFDAPGHGFFVKGEGAWAAEPGACAAALYMQVTLSTLAMATDSKRIRSDRMSWWLNWA